MARNIHARASMLRTRVVLTLVLATPASTACTGGPDPTVPSVGGATAAGSQVDTQAQELAFVECMRNLGITDMPDPAPGDTSGHSSVRYAVDVMGKSADGAFLEAIENCKSLLPELPPAEPPTTQEVEALRQFSQCMRDNGLVGFPDIDPGALGGDPLTRPFVGTWSGEAPEPFLVSSGGNVGINLGDPAAAAAWEACVEFYPVSGQDVAPW
jgi:hypothetical protein